MLNKNPYMKRLLLFLFLIPFYNLLPAQNALLKADLERQKVARQAKFRDYITTATPDVASYLEQKKAVLAGFIDNTPIFWQLDDRRANIAANVIPLQEGTLPRLNGTKLDGSGLRIMVMDGGKVFEAHQEFTSTGTTRITDKENGSTSYSAHATNVAGIIGAAGVRNFSDTYGGAGGAKGVLPNVLMDSYAFTTTPLGDNYQKLQNATGTNISNHSYGINVGWSYNASGPLGAGWYFPFQNYSTEPKDTFAGSYYDQDASFDRIVYANPDQIVVKSAGNYYGDGPNPGDPVYVLSEDGKTYRALRADELAPAKNCAGGFNCIGWGSLAKNIIVVGAADQLPPPYLNTSNDNIIRSGYSSVGPRKDGAIKPDISAVGTNMVSPTYTSATVYDSYIVGNGTSFSAPVISGIAGALTQLYQKTTGSTSAVYKADEMKALLIHSASDAGRPGPDIDFGWGFADATKAAELVLDKAENKIIFERKILNSGTAIAQNIIAKAGNPIKVSISWIDPAAVPFTTVNKLFYDTTSRLVNDLDLRITDTVTGEIYYPWKLSIADPLADAQQGDNTVDNIEQVLIQTPVAGRTYRVDVSHKGNLVNENGTVSPQNFTIIATGFEGGASQDPTVPTARVKNITVNLDQNGQAVITAKEVDNGSSDNETPQDQLILTLNKTTFSCADVGANNITLTVTDSDGKSASATAVVTVVDNLAPEFEVQSVTLDMAGQPITLQASQIITSVRDNCDSAPEITFEPNQFTRTGTYNVLVRVKDKWGNTAEKNVTVIVKDSYANISDLFNITVQNETCDGKGNGKITVQASRDLAYSYKLNDGPYTAFRNSHTFDNLKAGIYKLCIKLANETEYCYELNVGKPINLLGKVAVSSDRKTIKVEILQGTAPFTIHYGDKKITMDKTGTIEIPMNAYTDVISISSAIQCEGAFNEKLLDVQPQEIILYPNPVTTILKLQINTVENSPADILIYDMSQKLLLKKNYSAQQIRSAELDLSTWNAGLYMVVIRMGDKIETRKIIKK